MTKKHIVGASASTLTDLSSNMTFKVRFILFKRQLEGVDVSWTLTKQVGVHVDCLDVRTFARAHWCAKFGYICELTQELSVDSVKLGILDLGRNDVSQIITVLNLGVFSSKFGAGRHLKMLASGSDGSCIGLGIFLEWFQISPLEKRLIILFNLACAATLSWIQAPKVFSLKSTLLGFKGLALTLIARHL